MSGNEKRQRRDLDLLMKSYRALEAEQDNPSDEEPPAEPSRRRSKERQTRRSEDNRSSSAASSAAADQHGDDDVVMYRGRPVRRGSAATPGAGSSQGRPTKFRGAGGDSGGKNRRSSGGSAGSKTDRVKQALATLAEMHEEGLITKSEYDAKRRQLLNRL